MAKTKMSSKYQVVIPKAVRKKAGLIDGQVLDVYPLEGGGVVLMPKVDMQWPDDYVVALKDVWKDIDVAEYIRNERDSWD